MLQMSFARFASGKTVWGDLLASFVVFLVALPLCIGIAIAAGMPPAAGIITGIIGGLVCGSLGGCPLQVTGPAAGLVVLVAELIHEHGLAQVGLIIALAGAIQLATGVLGLARWFRAVPPSVINGMLSGIGVLIFAAQFHVMVDDLPKANGVANLLSIPQSIYKGIVPNEATSHTEAAMIGLLTITCMIVWQKFFAKRIPLIPAALIAVTMGTAAAAIWQFPIKHVSIPANLFAGLTFDSVSQLSSVIRKPEAWFDAAAMALIASAETLLTASALDKMHTGSRTDYNRELRSQGIGNMLCGLIGVMPLTGVMVRSGVNVNAGAKTRMSSILHGFWLLVFVCMFPFIINMIPTACLAALLVYTGYKLVDIKGAMKLKEYGKGEVAIYAATLGCIVGIDLLTGVVVGIGLALVRMIYQFSRLDIRITEDVTLGRTNIYLTGAATFLNLPSIAEALEDVPANTELHIHVDSLEYIDHACLDLLMSWEKQHQSVGGSLVIDWDSLGAVFRDRRKTSRNGEKQMRVFHLEPTITSASISAAQPIESVVLAESNNEPILEPTTAGGGSPVQWSDK